MSAPEFDTLDLAMLAVTIAEGTAGNKRAPAWSQSDCEELQAMAETLGRVWSEVDEGEWDAVFVYDVTRPVGEAVAARIRETGESLAALQEFVLSEARRHVAHCMAGAGGRA